LSFQISTSKASKTPFTSGVGRAGGFSACWQVHVNHGGLVLSSTRNGTSHVLGHFFVGLGEGVCARCIDIIDGTLKILTFALEPLMAAMGPVAFAIPCSAMV
jgi:hypothetical protein